MSHICSWWYLFSGEEWRIAVRSDFKSSNKLKDKLRKLNETHLETVLRLIFCRLRLNCDGERFPRIRNRGGSTWMQGTVWPSGPACKGRVCWGWTPARFTHLCPLLFSPGLTDEEIDLAVQQSGTATDEPSPLGPATPVVPVQPPHLISQPYSKSPVPSPAYLRLGFRTLAKSSAPKLPPQQTGRTCVFHLTQKALKFF